MTTIKKTGLKVSNQTASGTKMVSKPELKEQSTRCATKVCSGFACKMLSTSVKKDYDK